MSVPTKSVNPGQTVSANLTINQYLPSIVLVQLTFSMNPPNGSPAFILQCAGSAINQATNTCPLTGAVPSYMPPGVYLPDTINIATTVNGATTNTSYPVADGIQAELTITVGTPQTPPPPPGQIQPVSIGP